MCHGLPVGHFLTLKQLEHEVQRGSSLGYKQKTLKSQIEKGYKHVFTVFSALSPLGRSYLCAQMVAVKYILSCF